MLAKGKAAMKCRKKTSSSDLLLDKNDSTVNGT